MGDSNLLLEICVDCPESIKSAIHGGADRLELCSALSEGGLTPTIGLTKLAKRISPIPIFAMIRIRGGNFVYDQDEFDAMLDDLHSLKSLGIDGFVFGALTSSNEIAFEYCRKIIEAANPLPVTFHRAFDEIADPLAALDEIENLGFSRILTSGQGKSAEEGIELIADLVKRANDRLIVMPGAGITEKNVSIVRDKSGAREFHGSAKRDKGNVKTTKGFTLTDPKIVETMVTILRGTLCNR